MRWSWPEYSARETEATGVAKIVESWSQLQGKTTVKEEASQSLTAIHFSSCVDESQLHEGLDHILLVFVVFVAVTKQIVQDGFKKTKHFC